MTVGGVPLTRGMWRQLAMEGPALDSASMQIVEAMRHARELGSGGPPRYGGGALPNALGAVGHVFDKYNSAKQQQQLSGLMQQLLARKGEHAGGKADVEWAKFVEELNRKHAAEKLAQDQFANTKTHQAAQMDQAERHHQDVTGAISTERTDAGILQHKRDGTVIWIPYGGQPQVLSGPGAGGGAPGGSPTAPVPGPAAVPQPAPGPAPGGGPPLPNLGVMPMPPPSNAVPPPPVPSGATSPAPAPAAQPAGAALSPPPPMAQAPWAKTNESQGKAMMFAEQMNNALEQLMSMGPRAFPKSGMRGLGESASWKLRGLGLPQFSSADEQARQSLFLALTEPLIRIETGAAKTPSEERELAMRYIPLPGEAPQEHARKIQLFVKQGRGILHQVPPAMQPQFTSVLDRAQQWANEQSTRLAPPPSTRGAPLRKVGGPTQPAMPGNIDEVPLEFRKYLEAQ